MLPYPLHPAVVHLPIALVVLLPFFALGALVAIRRGARAPATWGLVVLLLGVLTGASWVAVQTGEREEHRVENVIGDDHIETHEEAAERFLGLSAVVLLLSGAGLLRGRAGRAARYAAAAGTIILLGAGWTVGHSGGELVYRYGAAEAYVGEGEGVARGAGRDQGDAGW